MRNRFGVFLTTALGAAVAAAVVGPVQALAYRAKDIVFAGLVYDDVYGVFDGYALMKKGKSIELVNSSRQVVKSTKKNTDGWIGDSSRFEMADGLLGIRAADGYGYTSINGRRLLSNKYPQT